jgi:hypothetical protein
VIGDVIAPEVSFRPGRPGAGRRLVPAHFPFHKTNPGVPIHFDEMNVVIFGFFHTKPPADTGSSRTPTGKPN